MNAIDNRDNFPSFLYSAPETDSARLPFLLHAVRMGCGFQESFFKSTGTIATRILPSIFCLTDAGYSTLRVKIIF